MQNQALEMPDFDLGEFDFSSEAGQTCEVTKKMLAALNGNELEIVSGLAVELKGKEDVAAAYDDVQHIQLTFLQHKLLAAISDAKLSDAPLRDVISAFKVLKDKQLVANGRPTEITGLVGYLEVLEREEIDARNNKSGGEQSNEIDITPTSGEPIVDDGTQLNLFENTAI